MQHLWELLLWSAEQTTPVSCHPQDKTNQGIQCILSDQSVSSGPWAVPGSVLGNKSI